MTEQQKADAYGQLLNEHTRVGNKIAEIKAQNFEISPEQKRQIDILQSQQINIMEKIKKLFY
jgi:hypothetical protein